MLVTLITGTSTGIGAATALYLARKGYHVFASMRNPNRGSAPLRDAASKEGLDLDIIRLDVDDPGSGERAVEEVLGKAGRIDVLINNAGIGGGSAIEEISDDFLKSLFETNFFGAMRLIRLVLPGMRRNKSGTIVNVSSLLGRIVTDLQGAYASSKYALEAASEILALMEEKTSMNRDVNGPTYANELIKEEVARKIRHELYHETGYDAIWRLSNAGFVLRLGSTYIFIDPILTSPLPVYQADRTNYRRGVELWFWCRGRFNIKRKT